MMSDEKLIKISLLITLIGIAMIYVVSITSQQIISIKDIKENDIGKQVTVNGTILSFSKNNGNVFIELGDGTGNITVVMFEHTVRSQQNAYELKNGDKILVKGQVNVYKNELEIIASNIVKVEYR